MLHKQQLDNTEKIKVNGSIDMSRDSHRNNDSKQTVTVVFVSLLLDLLAFTMILPLLPSLMEHYRKNDDENGLYPWLLNKLEYIRLMVGAPERFNSVLFGGKHNLQFVCNLFPNFILTILYLLYLKFNSSTLSTNVEQVFVF